ncbi:MAG: hypothetical protein J6J27_04960 [Alphaproteobacteria bacterium]|nr:hypothetical protein [Alphaproteobacteria bacterium]
MKKLFCIICSLIFVFSIFNISVFATEKNTEKLSNTDLLSEAIIEEAEGVYNSNANTRATGLISQKTLTLSKTGTQLIISAKTKGSDDVDKCGFTYIKLQRLVNGSWTDYSSYCYYDQYNETNSKTFSKYITPPSGYTYRVVCEHYAAKKTLLIFTSEETSYNETTSLSF